MRIISKFHDYYDCMSRQVFDKQTIFVREQQCEKIDKSNVPFLINLHAQEDYRNSSESISSGVIFLAGKIYPFIRVFRSSNDYTNFKNRKNYNDFEHFAYNLEDFEKFCGQADMQPYGSKNYKNYFSFNNFQKQNAIEFFNYSTKDAIHVNIEHKSPIILYSHYFINGNGREGYINSNNEIFRVINPELRKFGFQTARSQYETFQDVYQFISGVLGNQGKEMVQLSDKSIAQKHGFDKYSFRKDKTK